MQFQNGGLQSSFFRDEFLQNGRQFRDRSFGEWKTEYLLAMIIGELKKVSLLGSRTFSLSPVTNKLVFVFHFYSLQVIEYAKRYIYAVFSAEDLMEL